MRKMQARKRLANAMQLYFADEDDPSDAAVIRPVTPCCRQNLIYTCRKVILGRDPEHS